MKKLLMAILAMVMLSACVRKHCYVYPRPSEDTTTPVGSIMIKKWECFGRITVNQCTEPLELVYLGRTHPGNYIRIGSRVGNRTQFVAGTTYPGDSKFIQFQDAKIGVIEATDNWIRFKSIVSTVGCDKVYLLEENLRK